MQVTQTAERKSSAGSPALEKSKTIVAHRMYINGKWVDSESGDVIHVINPSNERVIATVPKATREEAKHALESAQRAQGKWEQLSPLERAGFLFKIAERMEEEKERLARVLTSEQGKPLYESRLEVEGAAQNFKYYAEFARRLQGDILPSDYPKQTIMILKLPIGVVASITPWNFPSSTVARKLAPALITGNTVVTKPSSNTPLSTVEIVKIAEESGLPRGVLNLVTGSGSDVGDELVRNKITGLVTITGSTEAGRKIMESASSHVARLILELGGKAPLIVWDDADLDWAVKCAIWARFWNCGQTCISSERLYVHEKISGKFLAQYAKAAKALRIGNPTSQDTDLGPMVSSDARDTTAKFVEQAREEGDKIMIGGKIPREQRKGFYFEPTIITDVDQDSPLIQKEIFGPVIPVMEVDNFDKTIEYSNDSEYGLASYLFTRDANRIMKAMYEIKFGECYVNQIGPEQLQGAHTGFRQTGMGAEGSKYGVENYTQLKTSYIDWDDRPKISYLFPYGHKGSS